jgi:hypothetical protein
MDHDLLEIVLGRDALLAIGVTLFVFGIILRGLAREHGRTLARRKQHDLAARHPGEPIAPPTQPHFEKHFARSANSVFVLGMIVVLVAIFR